MTMTTPAATARGLLLLAMVAFATASSVAQPIASNDLEIRGMALEVVTTSLDASIGVPSFVFTRFAGSTGDAPVIEGLVAEGELVGPDIAAPITLRTAPGRAFAIPGLPAEGEYRLEHVRLTRDGAWLSDAIPSFSVIRVSDTLRTEVKIRQLTPEELRARGIVVDLANFTCYSYTLTVYQSDGTAVVIEYPVIVDNHTRETHPVASETPYVLPPIGSVTPPRWTPPTIAPFDLEVPIGDQLPPPSPTPGDGAPPSRPSIPAALVIPGNLAVLHQFFSVGLSVANGSPAGSSVLLVSASASLRAPAQIRVAKTDPSVAPGQPLPLRNSSGGALRAQEEGKAEWTVEGLASGTWPLDVDVRATMTQPGQPDVVLHGTKSAAVVVHDPRFNITFSHPATVEGSVDWTSDAGVYSAWAFVTNMSPATQALVMGTGLSSCGSVPQNLCLVDASAKSVSLTLAPGETREVEYRLKSQRSGDLFAASTSADDGAIAVSFQLQGGEAISPATLVMPWYARYLDQAFVKANLQLLGRGYAIATSPLGGTMAAYPRVIKTDVFARAVDIARAGQRVFVATVENDPAKSRASRRFAYANLALDLLGARDGRRQAGESLGHRNALEEWDALRRIESENGRSGRSAAAALARQLEAAIEPGDTLTQLLDRFTAPNAHRSDFVAALVSGGNARIALRTTAGLTTGANDAGTQSYSRKVPFADVHALHLPDGSSAELGLVGNTPSSVELVISTDGPVDLELVYPGGTLGAPLRLSTRFINPGNHVYTLRLSSGVPAIDAHDESGAPLQIAAGSLLPLPSLEVLAARQDLYLDPEGHKVSLLFNRPVRAGEGDLFRKFSGEVVFADGSYSYRGRRPISAAALQEDGRIVNLTFDHALHANVSRRAGCAYSIAPSGALVDAVSSAPFSAYTIPPVRIDNDRPAAIFYGRVLAGDGSPIAGADVILQAGPPQYDTSNGDTSRSAAGAFFFEYVPRDPVNGYSGAFTLRAITAEGKSTSTSGTIRTPGAVYPIDLQFLGRGSAEGFVRYDDSNAPAVGARVVVGSKLFNQFRSTTSDASGFYRVTDVPVGPLTFSATDADGNVVYASNELTAPGQAVSQNLLIHRTPFPGRGVVRGVVKRSDGSNEAVSGAHVGVYSQGYGLLDGYTDLAGRFDFRDVPAGFVTLLAEDWTIAYESASVDFELHADETREVTLTLPVHAPNVSLVRVEGLVTRSDAGSTVARPVPGALVQIDGYPVATADTLGRYAYESVPSTFSGRRVRAWDPESGRIGAAELPTLRSDIVNAAPIHIALASGGGRGSVRVQLLDVGGSPVTSAEYKVYDTAYPVTELTPDAAAGVFTRSNVPVGSTVGFIAVPRDPAGRFGEQFASGSATVELDGQTVSRTLRLPGQGQLHASLVSSGVKQLGGVRLSYSAWDDAVREVVTVSRTLSTAEPPGSGIAGYARFSKVPAQQRLTVSADLQAQGNAEQKLALAYEGQVVQTDLLLGTRAKVRGRVMNFDGVTPIAGAVVTIEDGVQDPGPQVSAADGSFEFADVAPNVEFRLTASWPDNGIFRTGFATGRTPEYGGLVDGLVIGLRRRANVEGRIVYGDRKVDPADPTRTIPDDTPGDYSDNAPVARGEFWLSELDFPRRDFGSSGAPLHADLAGNFVVASVFEGPFRVTASNLDRTASVSGAIELDGVNVSVLLAVGAEGAGSVEVRVVDPNHGYAAVPNAEVMLVRDGAAFDFGSTDASGLAGFPDVPARGSNAIAAYSKALGRSGGSQPFSVVAGESRIIEVPLERSGNVSGSMIDSAVSGAGVAGAHVDLFASGYSSRSTTAANGSFIFAGVREGSFRLEARDPLSNRRATGEGAISVDHPDDIVELRLPRWGDLRVNVWLPDDYGSASSTPAGPVAVDVKQLCYNDPATNVLKCDQIQSLQGSSLHFDRVLPNSSFIADVRELGGAERKASVDGTLFEGETRQLDVVLPAFGRVNVRVVNRDTRAPMENVRVQANSEGVNFVGYTDATGAVLAGSFALNRAVWVGATTLDGRLSGNATTTIARSSVPAEVTIELASYASVAGYVEAERGGPSIGTRVVAQGSVETVTDGAGRFSLGGFVTGARVDLVYLGSDGETIGARQSVTPTAPGANEVPPVRLDSTPPRIVSIDPSDGAVDVSLDSRIEVVFSEQLAPSSLVAQNFALAPNGTGIATATTLSTWSDARGHVVALVPTSPLLSHTLYRLVVAGGVADMSGHALGSPRGASFTTSDKSEPQIVRVRPDPTKPAPLASVFEIEFNEPLKAADWQTGGAGSMTLSRLSGEPPVPVQPVAGTTWLDETSARILRFSPSAALEAGVRYRLAIAGVRDEKGNALSTQAIDFATADTVRPFVAIEAPVTSDALVSGLLYTTRLALKNGDASGSVATDIDRVEYFQEASGGWQLVQIVRATATNPNFSYSFTAPSGVTRLALRAVAFDTSFNESLPADVAWSVVADDPPKNVKVVTTVSGVPATEARAGATVNAQLTFDDEGLVSTYTLRAVAVKDGATIFSAPPQSAQLSRQPGSPWGAVGYSVSLPRTLPAGTIVTISAEIVDSRGQKGSGSAIVTILQDAVAPRVTELSKPAPDAPFIEGDLVSIVARASDGEVGVKEVRATLGTKTVVLEQQGATDEYRGSIQTPNVSGTEPVAAELRVVAVDFAGNQSTPAAVTIRVTPVFDPTAPVVSFVCGTNGAVMPSDQTMPIRISAIPGKDPVTGVVTQVYQVAFYLGDSTVPFDLKDYDATNLYATTLSTSGVAPGATLIVRAEARTVGDSSGSNWTTASTTIRVVAATNLTGLTIQPADLRFENTSIYVKQGTLTIDGSHRFADVIVLDQGHITHTATDDAVVRRLDVAAGTLFVACGGDIDVTARGYSGTSNSIGKGFPNQYTGSRNGYAGSHGGLGNGGTTSSGPTYDSVTAPNEPGGAGSRNPSRGWSCGVGCGAGGGVVKLDAATAIVDGSILANGKAEADVGGGAGGTVRIVTSRLAGGASGQISADGALIAGGGRISIRSSMPIGFDASRIHARSGPDSFSDDQSRGSAGTVYLRQGSVGVETEELVIDNAGLVGTHMASLPDPGSGLVESVDWPRLTLSSTLPQWIEGAWIELRDGNGAVAGSWRIASRLDSRTVALDTELPAGPASAGQSWRGFWKFTRVVARRGGRYRVAPLRAPRLDGTVDGLVETSDLDESSIAIAVNTKVSGRITADSLAVSSGVTLEAAGRIDARDVTIASLARLQQTQLALNATSYPALELNVSHALTVDGQITATGAGFRGSVNNRGRTWPGITASYLGSGGSFGGRGRDSGTTALAGSVFGSVVSPSEPGAAGAEADWPYGSPNCDASTCSAGGGVIRINAGSIVLNGSIESLGQSVPESTGPYPSRSGSGAGGSVSIATGAFSGAGSIRAEGGARNAPGGGGRIVFRSGGATPAALSAAAGEAGAAPGTIVVFRNGSSTFGDLIVSNNNRSGAPAADLPALGGGFALAGSGGSTLVTALTSIPAWNAGRWIELRDAAGVLKGTWQVVQAGGATLQLESGASVAPGDEWRAIYRFDAVNVSAGCRLASIDPVVAPGFDRPTGALSFASGQESAVIGGSTVRVVLSAGDVQSLQRVILRATGPVATASSTQARVVSGTSTTQSFDVVTLSTASPGEVVTIVADVVDELGTVVTTRSIVATIVRDEVKPTIASIAMTPDAADLRYASGTALSIAVTAADNVGIASVSALIAGVTTTDSTAPYQFAWTAPKVITDTPFDVVITARDTQGNESSLTRTLTIVSANGGAAPSASFTWPTASATVPAGYPIAVGVSATDDSGVVRIELFEEDSSLPFYSIDAADFSTRSLSAATSRTLPAQPGPRRFRARVHDISPVYTEIEMTLASVATIPVNAASPDWVALQATPGVLASGTLTINDAKQVAGLYVLSGATVTHADYSGSFDTKSVNLDVAGDLWIERGGKVDVSAKGYAANVSYPGATTPGGGSGGSHVGSGGLWNTPASTNFGSVVIPREAGGGGGQDGSKGGGVVAIRADRLIVDGSILADGTTFGTGGGAGGSIALATRELGGVGTISASGGGNSGRGGGGGGAIALDYVALSGSRLPALPAAGGSSSVGLVGSAGSVAVSTGLLAHPRLFVDNGGLGATTSLPSLGGGTAASGSALAHLETGRSVAIPAYFAGHWVEVRTAGGELKGRWRVKAVSGFALELEPNATESIDVQPGDLWQGVYVFSAVETAGGASVSSADPIRIDTSAGK